MLRQLPQAIWGLCPNGNNLDKRRWTVDSAVVVRNYVMDDTNSGVGGVRTKWRFNNSIVSSHRRTIQGLQIMSSSGSLKIRSMSTPPMRVSLHRLPLLRHIAVVTDANLSFTRGLIWLEDVHYNADKRLRTAHSQKQHTFVWDNVAFDGPFTYRDFSYDALDVNQPNAATNTVNLGKVSLR